MDEDFEQFMKVANKFPLYTSKVTSRRWPRSLRTTIRRVSMPPSGVVVTGAEAVTKAHAEGARQFREGSRGRFEIIQFWICGGLRFLDRAAPCADVHPGSG